MTTGPEAKRMPETKAGFPRDEELRLMAKQMRSLNFAQRVEVLRQLRKDTLRWAMAETCPYCHNGEQHERCWSGSLRNAAEGGHVA